MENILPRREARENAFLLAFSQTFGDIPLAEAITSHEENDEEHPVDGFSKHLLLSLIHILLNKSTVTAQNITVVEVK